MPVRVLLIERDDAEAARLESECRSAAGGVEVTRASDSGSAREILGEREFDLVVGDLAVEDGVALFEAIAGEHPGLPVVILSHHGDVGTVAGLLAKSRSEDIFGIDEEVPMIRFFAGDALEACAEVIRTTIAGMAELEAIELGGAPAGLSPGESRALRIFARRTGAARVDAKPISGGLSGAKTLIVDAADAAGMRTAHVVAKLGPVEHVEAAVDGYEVATPYLPAGLGAGLAGVVGAGAAETGAVFYRLADDFHRSWFDCLAEDPGLAAKAVGNLARRFEDIYAAAPLQTITVSELREPVASDEHLRAARSHATAPEDLDAGRVEIRRGIQHCDLHGLNVLVGEAGETILIDYDNFAIANCALDPVTLELSTIFHRSEVVQAARGAWPSAEQAARWDDLDAYLEGCPFPEAIRACRAWAESAAAGPRELAATLMATALRQFLYENTDKELAAALSAAGAEALRPG